MNSPYSSQDREQRTNVTEDIINLSCVAALFLLIMFRPAMPHALAMPAMMALLLVVSVLFVRKLRRNNQLFRRMREQEAMMGQAGIPGVPGMPSRMTGPERPPKRKQSAKAGRRR